MKEGDDVKIVSADASWAVARATVSGVAEVGCSSGGACSPADSL